MDKRFTVHVVPHTHWDREWYFTLEEFRYRLIKLMDRLLDAMERGAIEYFQMDGQTIMLQINKAARSEIIGKQFLRQQQIPWCLYAVWITIIAGGVGCAVDIDHAAPPRSMPM